MRLVQDIYQGEYMESEHAARMEHGDIGDILMIKAGLIPKQDLSGLLIDLSARSMPANYNTNALQTDSDGRIYLISYIIRHCLKKTAGLCRKATMNLLHCASQSMRPAYAAAGMCIMTLTCRCLFFAPDRQWTPYYEIF